MHEDLYKLEDIAMKELKSITDNGKFRSREEIDSAYKLVDVLKDLKCMDDEYSEDDRSYDGSYRGRSYRGSYNGSYARGRGAKRYADGRYAPYSRYSRDDGKEEYINQLHDLMSNAPDEQSRQNIQRMIQQAQE